MPFINKNIELFLGDLSKRERAPDIVDMVYSLHRFGCMFDEYFLYNYPLHGAEKRESFVTDKLRWYYYAVFNTNEAVELFNDKKKSYDLFARWFKRDLILISSADDKAEFLRFVEKHKKFIVKPYNSSGGRGISIKNIEEIGVDACFDELMVRGGVVCEELVVQSEKMAALHSSSVNTLRIPTIKDGDQVYLFHPLLRMGVGSSVVDNASSGGIFALIDPESGVVCSEARDEKGGIFQTHPDTGILFKGYEVPDWDQAVELVRELATVCPDCRYVGWDLAHTENGWVMIEGNPRGQIVMMQLFYDTGFKEEFERYIEIVQTSKNGVLKSEE